MPNTELQFHMPPRDIIDFACTVISQISQKVGMKEEKKKVKYLIHVNTIHRESYFNLGF